MAWWSPDQRVTLNNTLLWELDPVEVAPSSITLSPPPAMAPQEAGVLASAAVQQAALTQWLSSRG